MITLTTTWNPRGELNRLLHNLPTVQQVYAQILVVIPPDPDTALVETLQQAGMHTLVATDWSHGRYLALENALETESESIHYTDMDRLLRWVETRPEEWRAALDRLQHTDYLLLGRTPAAYATHPRALLDTEQISNQVISHLIGREVDVSAGSKGFSRRAASFLISACQPGYALGTDGEWTVMLNRAGYAMSYLEVDGLDWESADRYREQAASLDSQRRAADAYDADPAHWAYRTAVAREVIARGLDASRRPLDVTLLSPQAHFEVEDYLYFYQPSLTDERTQTEVDGIVNLLGLEKPSDILDLACGYGRHTNRLAALGQRLTGLDLMSGFLDIARQDALSQGLQVDYRQGDMRQIDFCAQFDVVLLLFTAFGYFEDEQNLQVLRNVARALRPGGRFLFDIPNRDLFAAGLPPAFIDEREQDLMINRSSFDTQSGRWYNRRVVIRNGVRKDKPFFVRMYNPQEISSLLASTGLEVVRMVKNWSGDPLDHEGRRIIVVARKTHL
ncbi:MAG: class I SAM-dependent methyltransferase [Anaerolineales bacterium]|nr:class I SAM-dependent methyltransferase [Anaerolineales bacterium]